MLGWVRKGQMVPEFEEAAFNAPVNKVVKCKTQFGWHLLQVLSEREESVLQDIQPEELHTKLQDPDFLEDAQFIDVREPHEVERAYLSGFQVLPLQQFGSWGPEVTTKLDPQKDTYVLVRACSQTNYFQHMLVAYMLLAGLLVTRALGYECQSSDTITKLKVPTQNQLMCHHGVRSLQVAKWLQTQVTLPSASPLWGFRKIYNISGGIHAYAVKADPSIPTY
ncbi:Peptidyl-prolyl cis-trans isomerase, PpiC-type [Cynara cardunculus var. scolymus]|uniref:Peptidyl-prolyl cis-trans isomerase n=1 Tax=Cynara cardunculus var. scolymus TaxID=59895 RepID=A0A124SAK1_CYNCS|nr:Peptidyl-prolyl cis-trans isomerase, PpiC-type [Cynara cardunculus var. scolymus]